MTSGIFHLVPLDSISVWRDNRQRRELTDIDVLADSIRRLGLIHPLVVTRNLDLVSGERRYTACKQLGWTSIPVQFVDEISPAMHKAIELEENVKRQDLDWQDRVRAIQDYHALRMEEEAGWEEEDTAKAIGFSRSHVHSMLAVAEQISAGNKMVKEAPKLSTAEGIVRRAKEREDQQIIGRLHESFGGVTLPTGRSAETILTIDFNDWIHTDVVPRFNLIHCDFPYGIEADTFNQGGAKAHGGYLDTKEHWESLMASLEYTTKHYLAPSCHIMFWFSMRKGDDRLYEPTARALERMGWWINPMPLIWMKSDGAGILPDPERGPRQIYETCLFGSRGDRKIVRAVANGYASPTVRDRHMSEKPEPMLRHFFGMLVDENTVLLDPTCGSGSALRAAESLGCKYCLGLEVVPEFAELARAALNQTRTLRSATAQASANAL
jgi:ParB family transcriptional regulator, chromosome partitioning protein